MPPDARTWRIVRDEHLRQRLPLHGGQAGGQSPHSDEELRDRRAGLHAPRLVAVRPAEVNRTPARHLATHAHLAEGQGPQALHQRGLLVGGQNILPIDESFRKVRYFGKQHRHGFSLPVRPPTVTGSRATPTA